MNYVFNVLFVFLVCDFCFAVAIAILFNFICVVLLF